MGKARAHGAFAARPNDREVTRRADEDGTSSEVHVGRAVSSCPPRNDDMRDDATARNQDLLEETDHEQLQADVSSLVDTIVLRVDDPSPQASAQVAMEEESMELSFIDDQEDDTGHARCVDDIDSQHDAFFIQTVLEYEPFETNATKRTATWDAIGDALVVAGETQFTSRAIVIQRIGMLTTLLFEQPHLLPPSLCDLILELNERNYKEGYGRRLGELISMFKKEGTTSLAQALRMTVDQNATSLLVSEATRFRKRVVEDEILLRLVMKHRPFETPVSKPKTPIWMNIVNEFNHSSHGSDPLRNTKTAISRVNTVTKEMLDDKCRYSAFISPRLRELVIEHCFLTRGGG